MAAWRYEITLLVLKKYFTRSLRQLMKYLSTLEEKFRISAQPSNILYFILYYINILEIYWGCTLNLTPAVLNTLSMSLQLLCCYATIFFSNETMAATLTLPLWLPQ